MLLSVFAYSAEAGALPGTVCMLYVFIPDFALFSTQGK